MVARTKPSELAAAHDINYATTKGVASPQPHDPSDTAVYMVAIHARIAMHGESPRQVEELAERMAREWFRDRTIHEVPVALRELTTEAGSRFPDQRS